MLCPGCNKFPAYDTSAEPELDLDLDGGEVTGSARIVLTSECCGEELKEATFDVSINLASQLEEEIRAVEGLPDDAEIDLNDYELDFSEDGSELTDRYQTETTRVLKNGTVKVEKVNPRYQKRFFGVHIDVTVTATKGDKTASVSGSFDDEAQSSAMDELV